MKSILLCIVCIVYIVFPLGATCPVQAEETLSSYDRSGNTTSQALLTPGFPQILGQPQLQIVIPGELASFSVVMADAHGLSFQWKFGGANIPDGTGDALLITNVTVVNQGGYAVVVANSFGSVTSSVAQLYIDSNGNGLPDSWELQYFGNLNQTAAGDFDHDGISNLQEFYDGTNPTNANSANWQLTILTDGGGVVGSSPTLLDYPSGQSVTLTASPNPPNQFYGWTGDLGTNINPAVVVMNTNKTIWARFTCFPPPQGLIAWWKGESDASDIIGGNNGTFYSGTTPVSATVTNSGKVGGAFTFDGTVYVQVPDAPSLRPAQFTLEAWVYPANWNGSQAIAARGSSVNENDAWWMGLNNGFPRFWADHAGNMSYIQSPTTIPTNQWSHLAISWDGGTNRLYVNGLLVASGGGTGPLQYDSGAVPVTIGVDWANNQPNAEHFSGRVDEVSLYNRALSDEEARDIYLSDVGGKCTNMPYFVTPPQLPYAVQQVGYVEQLSTVLGSPPVTYSVSAGTLPAGLTLSSSGLLGGIPATPATNVFAGLATDSAGMTREQVFSLQVLPPAMPTGLVAWWRAEGDALDAISTNNGVLTNGTGFAAGEVGLAFLFNGKTNYVQVGTNASLNFSNAMTFEGWIFPTGPGSDPTSGGTIISKEYQYEIARWADGTIRFAFANHTPGWNWVSSGYIAPLNQWTHIAVVYNGGAVSTYANGLLVNSYAGVGGIGVYSQRQNDFRIGGRQAISEYFQGQIDEASVYNRALSGAEVALIYNAGGAGKVSTGPYFVTPPALPDGIVNQAYSQIISSARGAAPVTYSIVSGNLPPGLSLNSGGVLSGAPTSTGSFSFTVSATDNAGAVNSQVFTLSIYASVLPPPGLISWWRAENNAVDSVGTNSGTLVNGAGFAQGVAGQAFAFTGYIRSQWQFLIRLRCTRRRSRWNLGSCYAIPCLVM